MPDGSGQGRHDIEGRGSPCSRSGLLARVFGLGPPLTVRRGIGLVVFAATIVGLASLAPVRRAVALVAASDVESVRAWILGFGVWPPVASAALMLLQTIPRWRQ